MAEHAGVNITYTPAEEASNALPLRITLEPEYTAEKANRADLADIDSMLAMAMAGISSVNRLIDRCRWAKWGENGDLIVTLGLYVWPSDINLKYELSLPGNATSSEHVRVKVSRSQKYWVDGSRTIELPWLLENATCSWNRAAGCVDAFSEPSPPPEVKYEQAQVSIMSKDDVYGVLEVSGQAVGWKHEITLTYQKMAEGGDEDQPEDTPKLNDIEAEDIPITATWTDEAGESQTEEEDLAVPPCVVELLAACDDGHVVSYATIKPDESIAIWNIYYSSCDGTMLSRRLVQGKEEQGDDE